LTEALIKAADQTDRKRTEQWNDDDQDRQLRAINH
jgi:hypothetical protein